MTTLEAAPIGRGRTRATVLIAVSVALAVGFSLVLDAVVVAGAPAFVVAPLAILFNATALAYAVVGAAIEWRRPGHAIGRLLLISGPLFAFLATGWTIGGLLDEITDVASRTVRPSSSAIWLRTVRQSRQAEGS